MNQNTYPKIFTHRNDHKSQVVIANAEQEAELPPEYLPPVVGVAGQTMTGENRLTEAMLSPEYAALLADREKLEQDRTTFAGLVADAQRDAAQQMADLESGRAALQEERDELTAGYKASMQKFEADRAKLDEDQRLFDAKAGSQPDTAPADDKTATTAPAPAAGPAKRVRTAKGE